MKKEIDNNQILQNNKDIIYQNFKVENLFKLQKISNKLSKENLSNKHSYPAYSSDTNNCGIIGYTDKPTFICDKEKPVYIIFGDHTRTLNIARKSFSVLDNVKVLIPCIDNDKVLMYLITKWKKQIPNLGYSRHWKIAKDCTLPLPIKINKDRNPIIDNTYKYHSEGFIPDWDYMEKKIKEIEQEKIQELENFLIKSELNNCELSNEDIDILNNYNTKYNPNNKNNLETNYIKLKKFKLEYLFTSENGDTDLQKKHINGVGNYVVSSGLLENGIIGKTDKKAKLFNSNTITVDMFGNSFYRDVKYKLVTHARVFALIPKFNDINEYNSLFIITNLKYLSSIYNYSNLCSWNKIKTNTLNLPIKTDKNSNPIIDEEHKYHPEGYIPDWDFMEKYIKAIQKIVIADVVKYKDNYLENLKVTSS